MAEMASARGAPSSEQSEDGFVIFRVGLQELMMVLPLVDIPLLLRNYSEKEVVIEVVQ